MQIWCCCCAIIIIDFVACCAFYVIAIFHASPYVLSSFTLTTFASFITFSVDSCLFLSIEPWHPITSSFSNLIKSSTLTPHPFFLCDLVAMMMMTLNLYQNVIPSPFCIISFTKLYKQHNKILILVKSQNKQIIFRKQIEITFSC